MAPRTRSRRSLTVRVRAGPCGPLFRSVRVASRRATQNVAAPCIPEACRQATRATRAPGSRQYVAARDCLRNSPAAGECCSLLGTAAPLSRCGLVPTCATRERHTNRRLECGNCESQCRKGDHFPAPTALPVPQDQAVLEPPLPAIRPHYPPYSPPADVPPRPRVADARWER